MNDLSFSIDADQKSMNHNRFVPNNIQPVGKNHNVSQWNFGQSLRYPVPPGCKVGTLGTVPNSRSAPVASPGTAGPCPVSRV